MKSTTGLDMREKEELQGQHIIVDPNHIKEALFESERANKQEELTRLRILKGISMMKKNPEKYVRVFEVIIPDKVPSDDGPSHEKYAQENGDGLEDYVQKYLEWGCRISEDNGSDEAWQKLCILPDKSGRYQLIKGEYEGENDYYWIVGSILWAHETSTKEHSESVIAELNPFNLLINCCTRPAIVRYK